MRQRTGGPGLYLKSNDTYSDKDDEGVRDNCHATSCQKKTDVVCGG